MADVDIPVPSGTIRGYLAVPEGSASGSEGPWPGVVVLHEIFGLTDDIKKQADRFAANGYLALAPDLYAWGNTARCLTATLRAMVNGQGRALEDIQGCRTLLADRDDCTGKVGVIGFCMGGALALLVSPQGFDVAAPNYGDLPRRPMDQLRGACPIVASYGYRDRRLRGSGARLDKLLTDLDVEHDVKEYPTAKHGFLFEHTGKTAWTSPLMVEYDPAAADDAWGRILTFFQSQLKGSTA